MQRSQIIKAFSYIIKVILASVTIKAVMAAILLIVMGLVFIDRDSKKVNIGNQEIICNYSRPTNSTISHIETTQITS